MEVLLCLDKIVDEEKKEGVIIIKRSDGNNNYIDLYGLDKTEVRVHLDCVEKIITEIKQTCPDQNQKYRLPNGLILPGAKIRDLAEYLRFARESKGSISNNHQTF